MNAPHVVRVRDGVYSVPCRSCGAAGGVHLVTISLTVAVCDCPGFAFRQRCHHVDAVTMYLRLAPLEVAAAAGPGIADVDVPPADPA